MDSQQLVGNIISSTGEVFSMMVGIDARAGEPVIDGSDPGPTEGVVALVGLAGRWVGTGTVSCSPDDACWLAGKMLGAEYTSVNEDVLDALGEIANMVIGNIKTNLEKELGQMGLSVPTVVYGRNFTTRCVGRPRWTSVKFHFGRGTATVQVMLAPAQSPHGPQFLAPVEPAMA
jgi:chemotaxis protein CheX